MSGGFYLNTTEKRRLWNRPPTDDSQSTAPCYDLKLWCDLKDDKERIEFLKSGRAWETGIAARSIIPDLIEVFEFRYKKEV